MTPAFSYWLGIPRRFHGWFGTETWTPMGLVSGTLPTDQVSGESLTRRHVSICFPKTLTTTSRDPGNEVSTSHDDLAAS